MANIEVIRALKKHYTNMISGSLVEANDQQSLADLAANAQRLSDNIAAYSWVLINYLNNTMDKGRPAHKSPQFYGAVSLFEDVIKGHEEVSRTEGILKTDPTGTKTEGVIISVVNGVPNAFDENEATIMLLGHQLVGLQYGEMVIAFKGFPSERNRYDMHTHQEAWYEKGADGSIRIRVGECIFDYTDLSYLSETLHDFVFRLYEYLLKVGRMTPINEQHLAHYLTTKHALSVRGMKYLFGKVYEFEPDKPFVPRAIMDLIAPERIFVVQND